jgi:hypothetical protein
MNLLMMSQVKRKEGLQGYLLNGPVYLKSPEISLKTLKYSILKKMNRSFLSTTITKIGQRMKSGSLCFTPKILRTYRTSSNVRIMSFLRINSLSMPKKRQIFGNNSKNKPIKSTCWRVNIPRKQKKG